MKHKLIHVLGTIFAIALVTAMLTISASAEMKADVKYLDENGKEQTITSAAVVTEDMTEWNTGWYVVSQDTRIQGDLTIQGDVHLILTGVLEQGESQEEITKTEKATLSVEGGIIGDDTARLTVYGQGTGNGPSGWKTASLGELIIENGIYVSATINSGVVNGDIFSSMLQVNGGYLNPNSTAENINNCGTMSVQNGYIFGRFNVANLTVSGGTIDAKIFSTGDINITGGTMNCLESGVNVIQSDGDMTVSGGEIYGSTYAEGDVTLTGGIVTGEVYGANVTVSDATVSGDISAILEVKVYSGTIGGVNSYAPGIYPNTVQIVGGTVNGDVYGLNIIVGSENSSPEIQGSIGLLYYGSSESETANDSVKINSGMVSGDIYTHSYTMNGGGVSRVLCDHAYIHGGSIECLDLTSLAQIYDGTIGNLCMAEGSNGVLVEMHGGQFGAPPSVYNSMIIDYTGGAFGDDYIPSGALYLRQDGEIMKGIASGKAGGGFYDPPFTIKKGWEVVVLPGAELEGRFNNQGTILVSGIIGEVTGNAPYYAINADTATVSSISASGGIDRNGVTYVQPDTLVTLQPKENGAVRWVTEPSYLTVQNNKFYMPDEVVSVKSSKLPLEVTPTIKVDGNNLTGFTAGTYYSISDAIFRPTGSMLPIRPEWYGTTVSIIKLGDGFATGDSFAQSLAIPAQSGGTDSGTGGSTGGSSGGGSSSSNTGEEIVISGGDWENAKNALSHADPGDTVVVKTDVGDTLPGDILAEAAGRDVTLKIEVGTSLIWEIDGSNLPAAGKLQDISLKATLGTKGIPQAALDTLAGTPVVKQLTLAHDGAFGFTAKLHVDLGKENAGNWANLYYYNQQKQCMDYESSVRISTDGDAALLMSHASQYAVVIDGKSHALPFQDVKDGDWFQNAVAYAYRGDLMAGVSSTAFDPNAKLTRAQVVQMLYNLEGKPSVTGKTTFVDSVNHWAATPILWAEQTGVVGGYENGTFRPNKAVTREELAQMLYNYAQYKKIILSSQGDLSKFLDGNKVSDWAKTAMKWATGLGVINGYEDNTLRPSGSTTRAEAASMIMGLAATLTK